MANVWFAASGTITVPLGEIDPPAPADATMMWPALAAKLASIVWLAPTLANVYEPTAPTELPSTSTSRIVKPALAVIVNDWLAPHATDTLPLGEIEPPAAALATIV